jgi:hypothetical protein
VPPEYTKEDLKRDNKQWLRGVIRRSGGTLFFKPLHNLGLNHRRWYILEVYVEAGGLQNPGRTVVHDISLSVSRIVGKRFDQKRQAAIGDAFNNDASDYRESIRNFCDLPDFEPTIVE